MKDFLIFDNEVLNIQENKIILSILLYKNGLSFSLYHPEENKYYAIAKFLKPSQFEYEVFIEKILIENQLIGKEFKQIKIQIVTPKTCIIPDTFCSYDNFEDFYSFNFGENVNDIISFYHVSKVKTHLIYSYSKRTQELLSKHFGTYEVLPHSASLISIKTTKLIIDERDIKDKMYIQVFDDFADILHIHDKELKFYNTFEINDKNELVYYVLNVFDQLKLNQEKTEIIFSGFIEKNDISVINIKKFVRFVYFESLSMDFNYYYKFQEILPHYFHNFLNINK